MMLSLLFVPVAGLDGGGFEPDAAGGGGAGSPCCIAGEALREAGFDTYGLGVAWGAAAGGRVTLIGGVAVLGKGGTGGVSVSFLGGGGPEALTARDGGPLGGGGVADAAAGVSPPFLLTHFFNSLS